MTRLRFDVVDEREQTGSLLVTSHLAVTSWAGIMLDEVTVVAFANQLLHLARRRNIIYEGYRLTHKRMVGVIAPTVAPKQVF